jgi:Ca2+-binding EF-hand superfamily protein
LNFVACTRKLKNDHAGFPKFDKDNDGFITKSEFMSVAGPKFSFDMMDADGDGRITRAEYEAVFKVCIQEQP